MNKDDLCIGTLDNKHIDVYLSIDDVKKMCDEKILNENVKLLERVFELEEENERMKKCLVKIAEDGPDEIGREFTKDGKFNPGGEEHQADLVEEWSESKDLLTDRTELKTVRKKPVIVKAYRTQKELIIETLEGKMKANIGDWIITGVNGEQYPCKPGIFEKTYDILD